MIGIIIGTYLFSSKKNIPTFFFLDVIACVSPIGILFGRIANFINGELVGKVTEVSWGIIFPAIDMLPRHPSQLYEAFFEGIVLMTIFYYLVFVFKALKKPGLIFSSFLLGYGVIRFSIEFLREPDVFFITNENPYGYVVELFPGIGISMGQLLTVPMFVFGLLMIILVSKRNLDAN